MGVDELRATEDEFLTSLSTFHASLSTNPAGGAPPERAADADKDLSDRLKRAQECLRLLHQVWADDKSDSEAELYSVRQYTSLPSSSLQSDGPPTRVGRFEIVRELGRGAFGIVFLALDPDLGREVALKVPRPEALVSSQLRRRFMREAQAAASLSHPNLVSVFEWDEWGPICYVATEYCSGPTLAEWIQRRTTPAPVVASATLVATLAAALECAHNQGIIHRDLKPSNVMLVPKHGDDSAALSGDIDLLEFIPKIADFGLAKLLESSPNDTRSSAILGTPTYMAPEQAEGRLGEVGRHSDVYGLGVILYELLTGQPPFCGATDVEILKHVALDEPTLPRYLSLNIPRDLEAICLRCLEKQPMRRYLTATALANDLGQFLAGRPTQARPLGPFRRAVKLGRRRPLVTALLALTVLVSLVGMAREAWHSASLRDALEINTRIRTRAKDEYRAALRHLVLAEDQTKRLRQYRHAADMAPAFAAWKSAHVEQAIAILERHRPKTRKRDLRSFAWHYLWRLCHSERLTIRGHSDRVYFVDYSRDGKKLVTASRDGTARLWDVATGRELATFRGHVGDVNMASLSPDGQLLATAGDDHTIKLWNVSPPKLRKTCGAHLGEAYCAVFSPDGTTIASSGDDEAVKLWDTATGQERASLKVAGGAVRALAFSPDGTLLATAALSGVCQIWDLRTRQTRIQLNGHDGKRPYCVCFSHDGRSLASSGDDRKTRIWDTSIGAEQFVLSGHHEVVQSISFAPDDRTLAAAVKDGSVWRWDLATRKPLGMILGHTKRVWDVKFSPDGRTLATASDDGTVKLWDATADQMHNTISGLPSPPTALAFSTDGKQVAAAMLGMVGEGATFRAWDIRTGAERGSYLHLNGRLGGAISSNGETIAGQASIQQDGIGIRLVSANDDHWADRRFVLFPLPEDRPVAIICQALSPNSLLLATGHSHGKVAIWALPTGRKRATMISENGDDVCVIRFSPDGKLLASANLNGTVKLWDVESGTSQATLLGHLGPPTCVTFSPDGIYLATASADRTVKVWNTASGSEVITLQGHSDELRAVAYSPDGKTLASGSEDGALKLWDVATYQELIALAAHHGGVRSLTFSPDGSVLLSTGLAADGRGEIFLWPTAPGDN